VGPGLRAKPVEPSNPLQSLIPVTRK